MTIELLQTLSLVTFALAGVFFLLTVALFFLLRVPKLIGELSGITARKGVEAIRRQNESSGTKAYKPSAVNAERGKLTDRISDSGRVVSRGGSNGIGAQTEKFDTAELAREAAETALLTEERVAAVQTEESGATTVLTEESGVTTVLTENAGVTTVLPEEDGAGVTTPLSTPQHNGSAQAQPADNAVTVDVERGYSSSEELID